jgi:hypothetical protein
LCNEGVYDEASVNAALRNENELLAERIMQNKPM